LFVEPYKKQGNLQLRSWKIQRFSERNKGKEFTVEQLLKSCKTFDLKQTFIATQLQNFKKLANGSTMIHV